MGTRVLFSVSPGDGLPIYRQLVEQVRGAIASGLLERGERLPSHRDMARELVIAPLTVKRAYDVLEQEGLITTRRGRGTFVVGRPSKARPSATADLDDRVAALVRQARLLELDERALLARVRSAWRAHPVRRRVQT